VATFLVHFNLCAQTWNWRTETVDLAGKFASIATDADGNVHLSYSGDGVVKYAFRPAGDKSKWFNMPLDNGDAYTSLALDVHGHPHICYTARIPRYAHWDGSEWKKESIASDNAPIGYSCAMAISLNGAPYVSWYRERNADDTLYTHIKFAEIQSGTWIVRTLDFDAQTGKWESMAIDPHGNPALSFDAFVKGLLRYAHKDGNDWKIETVDFRGRTNNVYNVGMGNALAFGKDGRPRISYEDGENVKFAESEGDSWKIQVIDSFHPRVSWVGYRTSVALDRQDYPHIAYDNGGVLKHAFWDGSKWHLETLASAGVQGYKYPSIAIDRHDVIYVSYTDPDDGSMKVAIGELKNPEVGTKAAVEQKP
jgi:hypothetical protein